MISAIDHPLTHIPQPGAILSMYSKIARSLLILAFLQFPTLGFAQEISESHIAEARKAIDATKATESFDSILIKAATQLKNQLTSTRPDKATEISATVEAEAIALASRRADLEREAARLFAQTFTEEELTQIATFFASVAGTKYLEATPVLGRELGKAAQVWSNGINRDLAVNVAKKLAEEAQ